MMLSAVLCLVCLSGIYAKALTDARIEDYEGRLITSLELVFEGSPQDAAAQAEFLSLVKVTTNTEFSAVRIRDSLQALFDSGRVANARVEVVEESANKTGPIKLRFVVQRQIQIGEVRYDGKLQDFCRSMRQQHQPSHDTQDAEHARRPCHGDCVDIRHDALPTIETHANHVRGANFRQAAATVIW